MLRVALQICFFQFKFGQLVSNCEYRANNITLRIEPPFIIQMCAQKEIWDRQIHQAASQIRAFQVGNSIE